MNNLPLYVAYQQYNPLRRLDWRWRRAVSLARRSEAFDDGQDDALTGRAVEFIRRHPTGSDAEAFRRLAGPLSDIAAAQQLRTAEGPRRLEVEARLLAGQMSDEIARRVSVRPSVVESYEGLFYHVRDRLAARTYIMVAALGRSMLRESPYDRDKLVKTFAYFGGSVILEPLLAYLRGDPAGASGQPDVDTPEGRLAERFRLAFAIAAELDGCDVAQLLRISCAIRPRPDASRPGSDASAIASPGSSIVSELPLTLLETAATAPSKDGSGAARRDVDAA